MPSSRRLEVVLAVDALVGVRDGQPERAPAGGQELELDAGLLGDLARRVARLGAERAGDRREHELVLGDDAAQLLDVHALRVQLVQQPPARGARGVVLEPFQQSFGVPVHGHGSTVPRYAVLATVENRGAGRNARLR